MKKLSHNYKPFFETLKKKNMSQNRFMNEHLCAATTLYRLRHDNNMQLKTLIYILGELGETDIKKIMNIVVEDDSEQRP